MACTRLDSCKFYEVHKDSANPTFHILTEKYCIGEFSQKCMRNLFITLYAVEPDDELLPNGFLHHTSL